jgi:uncharacterized protein
MSYSLKIDAYSHIVPPRYKEVLYKLAPDQFNNKIAHAPPLFDLEYRFRAMDKFEPLRQVLTLAWPPVEEVAGPDKAVELAQLANDEMAELVAKYPERFVAAIAALPINNMDAALKEAERAITELRLRGVYLHTPVDNKPLDLPEFMPLYEMMVQYDLPIYIHPMRLPNRPDYLSESESKYMLYSTFGWPYETTAAMTRLVFSGIMAKFPNLKIVTHHCGGMVPYFAERIAEFSHVKEMLALRAKEKQPVYKKPIIEYYKQFYNDTALYGNTPALMCSYAFFGAEHILFGTDYPLGDTERGQRILRKAIVAIEEMSITAAERKKIFEDNARNLMHLPT